MKKNKLFRVIPLIILLFFLSSSFANQNISVIDTIKITESDIPEGFRYGIIPGFARNMLKENPWSLDQNALNRFAPRIYPGADSSRMSHVHMTILANHRNPYDDDIVCYIFIYRDARSAEAEIKKLTEFVGYNSDRGIVLIKDNMAVYLLVDLVENYVHIDKISRNIQKKIDSL